MRQRHLPRQNLISITTGFVGHRHGFMGKLGLGVEDKVGQRGVFANQKILSAVGSATLKT